MDKIGTNRKSKRSRGRPSHHDTIIIQKDIRKYFDDGLSAQFCINETGFAKDTVYTYYKEWTEELIDKTDFITQQQGAKVRLVASLDKSVKIYNDQREFLLSKRTNKYNASLENTIIKCNYALDKLHIDKANVLLTPTLDVTLRKVIKEKWGIDIEQIVESPAENSRTKPEESS